MSCLSLDSYIKPQLDRLADHVGCRCLSLDSYIKPQLYNNGLTLANCCLSLDSYIKPQLIFLTHLHLRSCLSLDSYIKPQRLTCVSTPASCCLSLDSYIKPQRAAVLCASLLVVYLLIPTSNHNLDDREASMIRLFISWFLHQTTTSRSMCGKNCKLFISWFLHQTTTQRSTYRSTICCLSLDSYIKPQRPSCRCPWDGVVYLLIPTSNHNVYNST